MLSEMFQSDAWKFFIDAKFHQVNPHEIACNLILEHLKTNRFVILNDDGTPMIDKCKIYKTIPQKILDVASEIERTKCKNFKLVDGYIIGHIGSTCVIQGSLSNSDDTVTETSTYFIDPSILTFGEGSEICFFSSDNDSSGTIYFTVKGDYMICNEGTLYITKSESESYNRLQSKFYTDYTDYFYYIIVSGGKLYLNGGLDETPIQPYKDLPIIKSTTSGTTIKDQDTTITVENSSMFYFRIQDFWASSSDTESVTYTYNGETVNYDTVTIVLYTCYTTGEVNSSYQVYTPQSGGYFTLPNDTREYGFVENSSFLLPVLKISGNDTTYYNVMLYIQ